MEIYIDIDKVIELCFELYPYVKFIGTYCALLGIYHLLLWYNSYRKLGPFRKAKRELMNKRKLWYK